jgi:hypothetical protein
MGIQINGQTDIISATDGGLTVSGNLIGTASTATAAATAYGISGSATLSGITSISTINLTVNGNAYPSAGPLSNRNLIINGAMQIDQRNAGAAVTVNTVGIFSVDRWANVARPSGGGVYSAQQVSDSPTGFNNSLKLTVTTADTSLGTSDYYFSWQKIEGYNTADLMFGTANAKTVTLSFWVKSSVTGQFSAFLTNQAESYSQSFAYTISAADTWEFKTITFTGATAGTWIGSTNGTGLIVGFGLANGTTYQGTSGVWAAASYYGSTGDVNWMATIGNTFQYTGVQLEPGTVATPFERRSYGQELALCQRYFNKLGVGMAAGTTMIIGSYSAHPGGAAGSWWFPVSMRAAPTVAFNGSGNVVSQVSTPEMTNAWSGTINSYAIIATGSTASAEL